jgi:hypothetical protein
MILQEALGVAHPQDSLKLSRDYMPQIKGDQVDAYVEWLQDNGIIVKLKAIPARMLKPAQGEINKAKVQKMKSNLKDIRDKALVISNDKYIVDGLHRWTALNDHDPRIPIKVYQVGLPFHELVKVSRGFKGAEFESVKENRNTKLAHILDETRKKKCYQEPGLIPQGYDYEIPEDDMEENLDEAMRLAQNDFGWAGGHFVIYPNGKFEDAGQGHDEFFKYEAQEVLEKVTNESKIKKLKALILKYASHLSEDELDNETMADEEGEIVCFYFGYIRISTSPMSDGKKFNVGIDYYRSNVSNRSLKTMKLFLETMVDTFGKTIGNFEVIVNDTGNPDASGKMSDARPVMNII